MTTRGWGRAAVTHVAVFGAGVLAAAGVAAVVPTAPADHDHDHFRIVRMHASAVTDFSEDRRLAGFAQDLFVGRVVAQRGRTDVGGAPETQWTVEVLEVYQGGLAEGVRTIVNQQGGYDAESNTLVLYDGDSLLEADTTYLFGTRTNSEHGWRTLVPRYGDVPLAEITTQEERRSWDARWRQAVREQIPFRAGG